MINREVIPTIHR